MKGFDATGFTDPVIALQVARSKALDLLISDVVMPGLSGIELAAKVKGVARSAVILFSGLRILPISRKTQGLNGGDLSFCRSRCIQMRC
jgi:DNA-binding response OmpR family regulator